MNNFNTNSENDSISINVCYDIDLASLYFANFEELCTRIKFGRNDDIFLLGDTTKPYYTEARLKKLKKAQLIELDQKYELLGFNDPEDYKDYTKDELIDEILNVTVERHYEYLAETYSYNNIENHIQHNFHETVGYSQGDVRLVVNVDGDMCDQTKQWIDNVFWNTPVYIFIAVNELEFDSEDLLDDIYEYDKDEVLKKVSELDISEYAKEYITENLPDTPR